MHGPTPGSIAEPFGALVEMQQEGLIRNLGISTVNAEQVAEVQSIAPLSRGQDPGLRGSSKPVGQTVDSYRKKLEIFRIAEHDPRGAERTGRRGQALIVPYRGPCSGWARNEKVGAACPR